jgi:hypothetical protein
LAILVLGFEGLELGFTFGFKTLQQLTLLKRRGVVDGLCDFHERHGGNNYRLALFLARSNRSGDELWDIHDGVYCGL